MLRDYRSTRKARICYRSARQAISSYSGHKSLPDGIHHAGPCRTLSNGHLRCRGAAGCDHGLGRAYRRDKLAGCWRRVPQQHGRHHRHAACSQPVRLLAILLPATLQAICAVQNRPESRSPMALAISATSSSRRLSRRSTKSRRLWSSSAIFVFTDVILLFDLRIILYQLPPHRVSNAEDIDRPTLRQLRLVDQSAVQPLAAASRSGEVCGGSIEMWYRPLLSRPVYALSSSIYHGAG